MKKLMTWLVIPMFFCAFTGCDVDVKDEGKLPDVDVQGGELPDVDVDAPEVDVGTEKKEVTVPDVDVDIPEENDQ